VLRKRAKGCGGVTGDGEKLWDEELHHFYSSPVYSDDHVKEDKMGRECGTLGGRREMHTEFW
jgi:hypothetical protein